MTAERVKRQPDMTGLANHLPDWSAYFRDYRARWDEMLTEGLDAPYPLPAVGSGDGQLPEVVPASFSKLERQVQAAGWSTLAQYAVGHKPHATHGRPAAEARGSLALRMERRGLGAVAVYEQSGKAWIWEMFYTWSPTQPHRKLTTLAAFLAEVLP